ncbi:MAG: helix-turn-helix domain-containing protein [Clostridiales bacterium]|jgi:transcriptional regulator with XRE-family HTH domain|nr:helix-turn-helix domain-containing protein [Clostridiales bacterium]
MSIYFSKKLKQLRKDKDLTQEQIADIFHISPQAVSRWETGATYPDIEILPHLAIYFKVTIDELLGTEEIRSEEKINEYIRDIRKLQNSGKLYDAIELIREAVKEYPVNNSLQYHLLQALRAVCSKDSPDFEKHKTEIIATGERIINNDPNNWGIKHQLIQQYAEWGIKKEAKRILDTLPPEIWDSQEPWAGLLLDGEDWELNQRNRIIRAKYYLEWLIGAYIAKSGLSVSQKLEFKKAKMQIEQLIDTISGEKPEPIGRVFDYTNFAELYCEAGDIENALDNVEKAVQGAMHHAEQMDKTDDIDGSNYFAWSTARNLPWIIREDHLMKPQFDIIRNNKRFIKCVDELKANSRELK